MAAVLLLAFAGGIAALVREAAIANRRFDDVRELADSYLFEFHDAIKDLPGSTSARQLVVRRGLQYLDRISRERSGDRALTRELASAYERIGDVQGRVDFPNLGDPKGALSSYAHSLSLYREVAAGGRDDDATIGAANVWSKRGRILQMQGSTQQAEAELEQAVTLLESHAPSSPKVRIALPGYYGVLAGIEGNPGFPNLGRTDQALKLYQRALTGNEINAREHPEDETILQRLLANYNQMGQMQQALGNGPAAVESFRHGLDICESQLRRQPGNSNIKINVATLTNNMAAAYTQVMHQPREAWPYHERAIAIFREVVESDPRDIQAKLNLGNGLYKAGLAAGDMKDPRRALELLDESVRLYEAVYKLRPTMPRTDSRTAYQVRASVLIDARNIAAAQADIRTQLEIDDAILRNSPGDASAERNQAVAWSQMGRLRMLSSQWADALQWFRKAEAIYLSQQAAGKLIPLFKPLLESVQTQIQLCRQALAGN